MCRYGTCVADLKHLCRICWKSFYYWHWPDVRDGAACSIGDNEKVVVYCGRENKGVITYP